MIPTRWVVWAVVVALLSSGASGCTTLEPVVRGTPASVSPSIEVGDRIRVIDRTGVNIDLKVTAVGADFIEGTDPEGKRVRIAAVDIRDVSERRFDFAKTTLLGAGVGFVATAALTVVALGNMR